MTNANEEYYEKFVKDTLAKLKTHGWPPEKAETFYIFHQNPYPFINWINPPKTYQEYKELETKIKSTNV